MIVGVAVKKGDVIICLPKPNRHHDCIKYGAKVLGLSTPIGAGAGNQGFYDTKGTFFNREEAFEIAKENNQLLNHNVSKVLYSEDLW